MLLRRRPEERTGEEKKNVLGAISCMQLSVRKAMILSMSQDRYASITSRASLRRGEMSSLMVAEGMVW